MQDQFNQHPTSKEILQLRNEFIQKLRKLSEQINLITPDDIGVELQQLIQKHKSVESNASITFDEHTTIQILRLIRRILIFLELTCSSNNQTFQMASELIFKVI